MTGEPGTGGPADTNASSEFRLPKLDLQKVIRAEIVKKREIKVGKVVSTKNAKTIVVSVGHDLQHPKYKRIVRKDKKFHAHDEYEIANDGDLVRIVACRPLSKMKRWRLIEVIDRSGGV